MRRCRLSRRSPGTEEFIEERPDLKNPRIYRFSLTRPGTFHVEAWWDRGAFDDLTDLPLLLRCEGKPTAGTQNEGTFGAEAAVEILESPIETVSSCELSVGPDRVLPYRLRVTYPH